MNVSVYIARRYLFSRKKANIINIISAISMVVVAGVSAAMIIILSAFNGIESLVETLFSTFEADYTISPITGKTLETDMISKEALEAIDGVAFVSGIIEEDVWLQYVDPNGEPNNIVASVKGVDHEYSQMTRLDSMLFNHGRYENALFDLGDSIVPRVVLGLGVYDELDIPLFTSDPSLPIIIVNAPQRGKRLSKFKDKAFNRHPVQVSSIFSINSDLDTRYLIAPVSHCQEWFGYEGLLSGYEIQGEEGADLEDLRTAIEKVIPKDLVRLESRYERNAIVYQTNKSEKWATYLILLFILLIAAFNIVASLTMLIIEKKRDIFVLRSMGTTESAVRRVFIAEGVMIYFIGAIGGILLGVLVCWAQQTFGIIPLNDAMVPYWPVRVDPWDLLGVIITVMIVGIAFSTLLVRRLLKRFAL